MAVPLSDREAIFRAIETWPREDQVALARMNLHRSTMHTVTTPQRPSWRQMAGMLSNGQTPPSDAEVAQWLDEHRSEKYG